MAIKEMTVLLEIRANRVHQVKWDPLDRPDLLAKLA